MKTMKLSVGIAVAAAVFGMSLTGAVAKEEAGKTDAAPKSDKSKTAKPAAAKAVRSNAETIAMASRVVKEIAAIPKKRIPPVLLADSSAIVIVPSAAKLSFMVKGGSAAGVLLARDKEGKWSSPVFIRISGGILGWQIIGEPMDIVLVMKNRKHVDAILQGKFTLDTKIAVERGWLGLNMKGASARELKADVAGYVRSRGAFVEDFTVSGTTLQLDPAANDDFYTKPKVDAAEIASGKLAKATEEVKSLQKLLGDYAVVK